MKRGDTFLLLLGIDIVALAVLVLWYLSSYQEGVGSVGGMMGQMMGGTGANGFMVAMPGYVWWGLLLLLGAAVVGVVGFAYYLALPEIRTTPVEPANAPAVSEAKPDPGLSWSVLMKTAKPEEKKVLEVLAAHDGHYLQKFVVKEAGLSRLKTHRIVSRFAERGVVTVQKSGNTNDVALAQWLKQDAQVPVTGVSKG